MNTAVVCMLLKIDMKKLIDFHPLLLEQILSKAVSNMSASARKSDQSRNCGPLNLSHSAISRGSDFILDSLSTALFDAIVYLNRDLNLLSDSPKLSELLNQDFSHCGSLKGLSFTEFMPTKEDVDRFIRFMKAFPRRSASPIEVLIGLSNVRLYVTRTHEGAENFFVGIQIISSTSGPVIPPQMAPTVFRQENRAPSVLEAVESTIGGKESSSRSIPGVSYGHSPYQTPSVSLVTVFYRSLNMDLLRMAGSASVQSHPEVATGWLTHLYAITDVEAVREDIVRLLPNSMQKEFLHAEAQHDMDKVCSLLQQTTVGNLNMISFASGLQPTTSRHYICSACRLVLGHLPSMSDDSLIPFFNRWMEGYESLNVFCSSMRVKIALTWISCAIRRPHLFDTREERERLSAMFSKLISTTDHAGMTDSVRLLGVYAACLLWARYQLDNDPQSAMKILEACLKDMDVFSLRHPGSELVARLRVQALFNLVSLSLEAGDRRAATSWLTDLSCVSSQKLKPQIIDWLEIFNKTHGIAPDQRDLSSVSGKSASNERFPTFMSDY
jgi:hypothetical protein